MYARPATAPSWPYGLPSWPLAISTSQQPITTVIRTAPVAAVAVRSIIAQRSSRPGPPSPCTVSLRRAKKNSAASPTNSGTEDRPVFTSPPIANAPSTRAPMNSENSGMKYRLRMYLGVVGMEDLLDGLPEVVRERDRQRQPRRVALLLDGVDGLARDVHRLRERLLRELPAGAEGADVVLHGWKANFTSRRLPMSSSLSIVGLPVLSIGTPHTSSSRPRTALLRR